MNVLLFIGREQSNHYSTYPQDMRQKVQYLSCVLWMIWNVFTQEPLATSKCYRAAAGQIPADTGPASARHHVRVARRLIFRLRRLSAIIIATGHNVYACVSLFSCSWRFKIKSFELELELEIELVPTWGVKTPRNSMRIWRPPATSLWLTLVWRHTIEATIFTLIIIHRTFSVTWRGTSRM